LRTFTVPFALCLFGLANTHSGLPVPSPLANDGEATSVALEYECDDVGWRDAWSGSGGGGGSSRFLSLFCVATGAPRSFAFRSSVAKSGLLDVPGERYMERLFVWRSASSASAPKSCDDDDGEGPTDAKLELDPPPPLLADNLDDDGAAVEEPGLCNGVGGTTIGVEGCNAILDMARLTGVALLLLGDPKLRFNPGLESTPSVFTSTPSLSTNVPSAWRACSKSRSVRDTRR